MALQGKTAIITGGASGIGFATAEEFLRNGISKILILDLAASLDRTLEAQLKSCNPNCFLLYAQCDVTDKPRLEQVFRRDALQNLGGIDILVNAAGIFQEDNPSKTIAVNLTGLIDCSLIAMDLMTKEKSGRGGIIVNVSSIAGLEPFPFGAIYCASKSGVISFTRSIGCDHVFNQTGIKMVAICPGATETELYWKIYDLPYTFPWMEQFKAQIMKQFVAQKASAVGKGILQVLSEGVNGSIWACSDDKTTQVHFEQNQLFEMK